MKTRYIIFIAVILLAALLRFYALDRFPSGLNADEAAIGYNAYSLLTTGKDEDGETWPIVFKSFGDYKPGGYFYLVLPLVKLIGLDVWAVRLPSAILGVVAVLLIYQLAGQISVLSKIAFKGRYQLISALLLSISPWHLHFSRGGWESNAATTLVLAGVVLFIKGLKRTAFFLPSTVLLVLSMYVYQSTRLIAPVLGVGLVIIFFRTLWPLEKWTVVSVIVGGLLLTPVLMTTLGSGGLSRFSGVGLTADTGPSARVNELRGQYPDPNGLVPKILHNKISAYLMLFGKNYLDHFSGNFLFITGDPVQRDKVPGMGEMYLVEVPLLLLGVWFLLRKGGRGTLVVFFWLAIAPLAAALTFQTPQALRALNMVIPLTLITAAGLSLVSERLVTFGERWLWLQKLIIAVIALVYVWNVVLYLDQYYVHYPQTYPSAWEYGFDQVAKKVMPLIPQYKRIVITDTYDQPYIEMLFYLKYPPGTFQREVVLTPRDKYGFSTVLNFGKFEFGPIVWDELKDLPGTLVIGTPGDIPKDVKVFDQVEFPNGQAAFEFASI